MFTEDDNNERMNLLHFYSPVMTQEMYKFTQSYMNILSAKDNSIVKHSERVANYAMMIACEFNCLKQECFKYYLGGLLHDIGKVDIPDYILLKPSKLTPAEYEVIKKHPEFGYNKLKQYEIFKELQILEMVRHHHEQYDGTGYPLNLKGEEIPKAARILSVADSFEAMTASRVYRSEQSLDFAIHQLREHKGTQFDPEVVDVFLEIIHRETTKSDTIKFLNMRCVEHGTLGSCTSP
ncbi:HD-GYP domain-containing protein [Paenibacillus aestuarii]|uniref:HD-GYP domain-containing protein n=1 Tax=Paenibacillus aestuarii TaxID=516965 RepID=A0ABW0K7Z1_9BACL|nr:HD-GYP domain-containing protein [Paenibacillus aestuarii]